MFILNVQCFLADDCNGHMQTPHKFWCLGSKNVNISQQELCTWYLASFLHCKLFLLPGLWNGPILIPAGLCFQDTWGMRAPVLLWLKKNASLKSVSVSANPTTQSKFFTSGWMDNMKWTFCSFKLFTFGTYTEFKDEGRKKKKGLMFVDNVNKHILHFLKNTPKHVKWR